MVRAILGWAFVGAVVGLGVWPANGFAEDKMVRDPRAIRKLLNEPSNAFKGGIEPNTPLREAIERIMVPKLGINFRIDDAAFEATIQQKEIVDKIRVQAAPSPDTSPGEVLEQMLNRLKVEGNPGLEIQASFVVRNRAVIIVPTSQAFVPMMALKQRVRVDFQKATLEQAIETLADMTGANIVLDGRLGELREKPGITLTLDHVALDTAIDLIADMIGVRAVAIDNVLYVTTPDNAKRWEKEQKRGAPDAAQ